MPGHVVPLRIPLFFTPGQQRAGDGPVVPADWRERQFQYSEDDQLRSGPSSNRQKGAEDRNDEEEDDVWPETRLQRWCTSLVAWDTVTDVEHGKTDAQQDSSQDISATVSSSRKSARIATQLGDARSRRRVALGTQDGIVWIFQEKVRDTSPEREDTDDLSPLHTTPSKISIASPSSRSSVHHIRSDFDTVSSPTMAVTDTTEVTASPSTPRAFGAFDAEERLEEQWHAGDDKSVVGGMMEALGLQDGRDGRGRKSSHGSMQQPGTPTRDASAKMSPTLSRRSHASSLSGSKTPNSLVGNGSKSSVLRNDQQLVQSKLREQTNGAREEDAPSVTATTDFLSKEETEISAMEPLVSVQCTAPIPIAEIGIARSATSMDRLVILQRDGTLTICCLDEQIGVHEINLNTAKIADEISLNSASNNAVAPSPLMKLAALRSQAGSPGPGASRSRAQSSSGHPDAASSLPGANVFTSMQVLKDGKGKATSTVFCYAHKKRAYIIDCIARKVLAVKDISDANDGIPFASVGTDDDEVLISYISLLGTLVQQKIRLPSTTAAGLKSTEEAPQASLLIPPNEGRAGPLNAASSFLRREAASRSASKAPSIAASAGEESGKIDLGSVGIEADAQGVFVLSDDIFVTWSLNGISLARRVGDSTIALDQLHRHFIQDVKSDSGQLALQFEAEKELIEIDASARFKSIQKIRDGSDTLQDSFTILGRCSSATLSCRRKEDDILTLYADSREVWSGLRHDANEVCITASLPFNMERIALALSSGHLVISSLANLTIGKLPDISRSSNFTGSLRLFQTASNTRTQSKYLLGGTEEGDVIVWDANTLEPKRFFPLLTSPIVAFITLGQQDNVLRLHGCTACVGADGTILILLLDGLKDLYIIPGRGAPITMIAARANELLLMYADNRARVWDMASQELRRSIGQEQANALLEDGRGWWSQHQINYANLRQERGATGVLSSLPTSRCKQAGAVLADIRRLVEAAGRMVASTASALASKQMQSLSQSEAATERAIDIGLKAQELPDLGASQAKRALQTLRPLLACLLPLGLHEDIDKTCAEVLGAEYGEKGQGISAGFFCDPGVIIAPARNLSWSASKSTNTVRLLAAVAMLQVLSGIKDLNESCSALLSMLTRLSDFGLAHDKTPSLMVLAEYLLDPSSEIKSSAQTLFVSTLDAVAQDQLESLCAQYGDLLPSRGGSGSESAQALLLLGLVATQRYTELSPLLLKDISNSIVQFLADEEQMENQAVSIILCDRGFTIFQHYFDAMEVVRSLFALSSKTRENLEHEKVPTQSATLTNASTPTSSQKETTEIRELARAASLHVAEGNTPLFMTTLSHDILHARSPAHCNATMRLVALMVRRKPHILYPNLPRLAEAVVKSLDPTMTAMRTVVQRSATIIISELITTYPTIAFHKDTQRLAVGTFEGAIIMYDLKTATRLYVLEAHTSGLNGLTFSQDGHRLVSLCLRDGVVKVWKTGTGFRSFFAFGSAPRQVASFFSSTTNSAPTETNGQSGISGKNTDSASVHLPARQGSTTPYKSFDFGHVAGAALASSFTAGYGEAGASGHRRSPSASFSASSSFHTSPGHSGSPEALMHDLHLVRFEWLGDRNVKVRIAEASMVFDVA